MSLVALSNDKITELMGKSRARDTYGPKLVEFLDSDEAGINVREAWPLEFSNKQASALYQGFLNQAKKADLLDKVMVKKDGDECYLLNKEKLVLISANGSAPEAEEE